MRVSPKSDLHNLIFHWILLLTKDKFMDKRLPSEWQETDSLNTIQSEAPYVRHILCLCEALKNLVENNKE